MMPNGPAKEIAIDQMKHPYAVTIYGVSQGSNSTLLRVWPIFQTDRENIIIHVSPRTKKGWRNAHIGFRSDPLRESYLDRIDAAFPSYRVFDRKQAIPLYRKLAVDRKPEVG